MLKIYGTQNSRSMRPIWTAEEMGLEYELEMMPFPPRVFLKKYLAFNSELDLNDFPVSLGLLIFKLNGDNFLRLFGNK